MRNPTPEAVNQERLMLGRLEDDWSRLNRPHVNKDLRASLYTRILEMRANIGSMEAKLKRPARAAKAQEQDQADAAA